MEDLENYVAEYLNETIPDVVPYKYLPTQERSYEKLLGLKPDTMISRLDREKEVNEKDELKKYRQDACHVFYKKLRNEITSFVSLNWKLENVFFIKKPFRLIEIPIILQSQIRQHNSLLLYFLKWLTGLLTEIVKFFFINDQYRWEFNYVLTWLLIDVTVNPFIKYEQIGCTHCDHSIIMYVEVITHRILIFCKENKYY